MAKLQWLAAGRSDAGRKREHNEDSILINDSGALWCVSDGMGGHEAGDVASQLITKTLGRLVAKGHLADAVDAVDASLQAVHRALFERGAGRGSDIMGATVVVAVARDDLLALLWAGDSRAYLWRAGQCHPLTSDHTQAEQLIALGALTREQAAGHPGGHVVTRAIGAADELMADVEIIAAQPGDRVLLCSDGLGKHVADVELAALLARGSPQTATDALIELALKRGGVDNVSVIVVEAMSVTDKTPSQTI